MRLALIVTLGAVALGTVSARAQVPGADASPYPMEAEPPASATAKPTAKALVKLAKPVPQSAPAKISPVVSPLVSSPALPPVRPGKVKEAAAPTAAPIVMQGATQDSAKAAQGNASAATTPAATVPDNEPELGWSVVADPSTGVHIGLPMKMMPYARDAMRGTRWSSAHGDVQVETFRIVDPSLKLSALFEQEKKEPETRRVEYSVIRDDNFFISGMQGLKKFSVRGVMRNGEVRGFTMLYDQMMESIVAPVMVAMASAFSPFPQRSVPFAALAKAVDYGNGVVVSAQGHIITDAGLTRGCQVIVASGLGDAERIAEDKETGVALLRVYGATKLKPLAIPRDVAAFKSADVTLAGIPDPKEQPAIRKITALKARIADGNAIELRQSEPMAGFSGAAALDDQGRFIGLAEMRSAVVASTAPTAPPVRLVEAAAIRGFLDANNVPAVTASSADAAAALVRIICVRK